MKPSQNLSGILILLRHSMTLEVDPFNLKILLTATFSRDTFWVSVEALKPTGDVIPLTHRRRPAIDPEMVCPGCRSSVLCPDVQQKQTFVTEIVHRGESVQSDLDSNSQIVAPTPLVELRKGLV